MSWAELQNRRLQVRFLSHLPVNPEFMGLTALEYSLVCALCLIRPQATWHYVPQVPVKIWHTRSGS
jgi:hypothetical protein